MVGVFSWNGIDLLLNFNLSWICPEALKDYNCIPRTSAHGGYYGLVVVRPPRLQTFLRERDNLKNPERIAYQIASIFYMLVCWSLTSLCHSNGHIETMPAREMNPFTALTRIRSQFLRIHILYIDCHIGLVYEKLVDIFFPCYTYVCSVMRSYCPENLVTLGLT